MDDYEIEDMLGLEAMEELGYIEKPVKDQVLTARKLRYNSDKTSVTIPKGLTEIDYRAFTGCNKLTEWNIPFPNAKFYSEQGALIEKEHKILVCWLSANGAVAIPDGVSEIGKAAFFGCTAFTGVTIPESVTTIGLSAFEGCTGLTNISIP